MISGGLVGLAWNEALNKASAAASELEKECSVPPEAMVTVVAIGVMVGMVPEAVEALGFTEAGVLEGEFWTKYSFLFSV